MNPNAVLDTLENPRIVVVAEPSRNTERLVRRMQHYASTRVVGVVPATDSEFRGVDIAVYRNVTDAIKDRSAKACVIIGQSERAFESAVAALEAGAKIVVLETRPQDVEKSAEIKAMGIRHGALVLGPETSGLIIPGISKFGLLAHEPFVVGNVSVVTRSGSMLYETASVLRESGLGVRIGMDIGASHRSCASLATALEILSRDSKTESIIFVEEFGHRLDPVDLQALRRLNRRVRILVYPMSLFVTETMQGLARIAPPPTTEQRIIESPISAQGKRQIFEREGLTVFDTLHDIVLGLGEHSKRKQVPSIPLQDLRYCALKSGSEAFKRELEAQSKGFVYLEFDGDVGVASLGGGTGFYILDLLHAIGAKPANFSDFGSAFTNPRGGLLEGFSIILQNKMIRTILLYAPVGGLFEPRSTIRTIEKIVSECPIQCIVVVPGIDRFEVRSRLQRPNGPYGCVQHAIEENLGLIIGTT